MKFLLDTHLLLWAAGMPERLPAQVRGLIERSDAEPVVSAASLWEVAIKAGLGREDFQVDAALLRRGLLEHGYTELAISGAHATALVRLPPIHKDPFDRILVAQAQVEEITLLTTDTVVARYPGPIEGV